jgi:hypothetical protein
MIRLNFLITFFNSILLTTHVTWNVDDKSPADSKAGQPRGDCPYLNNLDSVGAAPPCQPLIFALSGIPSTEHPFNKYKFKLVHQRDI